MSDCLLVCLLELSLELSLELFLEHSLDLSLELSSELSAKGDACEDADMEAISFGSIKGVFGFIIGNILGLSPAKLVFVFPFKLLDDFD